MSNEDRSQAAESIPERIVTANHNHDGFIEVEVNSDLDDATMASDAIDIGKQLKMARESQDMAIASIANALKLDKSLIAALENGNLDAFRGRRAIFVEGYYRAYAGLLNIDVGESSFSVSRARPARVEALGRLKVNYHEQPSRPVVHRLREKSDAIIFTLVVTMIAVVGSVIWLVWPVPVDSAADGLDSASSNPALTDSPNADAEDIPFYLRDQSSSTAALPGEIVDAEPEPMEETPLPLPADTLEELTPPTVVEETNPADEIEIVEPQDQIEEPPSLDVTPPLSALVLTFTGESWVEVYDQEEAQLYFKMGNAGEVTTVVGKAPLRVLVGNTSTVLLSFNGSDIDLQPFSVGAVASLTLE